ncbi:uncharacterized protein BDV17DRAFT_264695 [Aspergillus undulatus]|uniref:uncharacterized protein n=1 Tax=Aspergillus undulatus TaxID=1810928 RepID=UPI003CCCC4FC
MYNPWGTPTHTTQHHGHHTQHPHPHPHSHHPHHAHHAHAHAHAHQTPTVTSVPGTVPGTASSGTRLDLDSRLNLDSSPSASPSGSSYQMSAAASQMRWLPSMITTRAHNHNAAAAQALPTISSGLRMQATPHAQHPAHSQQAAQAQAPVSMIVDSRASGGNTAQAQAQVVGLESEESDRSESPGAREVSGADALGEPEFGGEAGIAGREGDGDGDGDIDVDVLTGDVSVAGKGVGHGNGNGDRVHPSGMNLTTRKHGKRLTTKEEVSLFEICNRHAAEFGQRSNLCKWWMTVTMEFTRGQKHPYSWHSVRRKVELVTKQRMKFLEEQRDKGAGEAEDLSNPRWRTVVDAWIPTWQRWEDAEARRIEKRDSRRPRKRKWTVTTPTSTTITTDGWDLPGSSAPSTGPDSAWRAPSSASSSPMVNSHTSQTHNHTSTAPSATPLSSTPVRLPPGFDTLFSSQPQTQTPSTTSTPFNPHTNAHTQTQRHTNNANHNQNHNHPSTPSTSNNQLHTNHTNHTNPPPQTPDNTMMAAVLETLGKLNKHLDSNNNSNPNTSNPTSNPDLNLNFSSQSQPQPNTRESTTSTNGLSTPLSDPSTALSKLKSDLKTEMMAKLRAEWDKERAVLEEKLDSVQRTQEMILEMLRQEPT